MSKRALRHESPLLKIVIAQSLHLSQLSSQLRLVIKLVAVDGKEIHQQKEMWENVMQFP